MKIESCIFCEGYYDRAFWAEWLLRLECVDPGAPTSERSSRAIVKDPWGKKVQYGQFGFRSPKGKFVRVVPCGGRDNVIRTAEDRLNGRNTRRVERLLINVDADDSADSDQSGTKGVSREAVRNMVLRIDSAAKDMKDHLLIDDSVRVSFVRWAADDEPKAGLPNVQTLERLVCAAIAAAYPDRAPVVQDWLAARPNPPRPNPKEHAWSYMAGWHAENGCEDFYRTVWRDEKIAVELRRRLESSGAWSVVEELVQ